jgi:multidrug efflux pump subunit AcrB
MMPPIKRSGISTAISETLIEMMVKVISRAPRSAAARGCSPDQASRYGLPPQLIDDTLYDAFGQRQIAQYFTQLSNYYVIMEVLPSLQGDPATLDQIFLRSPTTGGQVPLAAFAK